ncbi:glycolipid 2-alpha-mannosyltransferase-domain-containing protein [Jimgerdemannia flammicorona]|uniref:Glycolipid 2-alpha-mannosyltransferase-domain-containing protein n=1 Tax=Jimgerdemannia flammicorona TaxID=994334 RepID=A0A433Q6U8_9FUNG|nr:glycolipid 2-alpha-mannosyltransferase-domain-containing protein [Jimgerdemannia flammicorona]
MDIICQDSHFWVYFLRQLRIVHERFERFRHFACDWPKPIKQILSSRRTRLPTLAMNKSLKYLIFAALLLLVLYQLFSMASFSPPDLTSFWNSRTPKQALKDPVKQDVFFAPSDPTAPWNTNTTRARACFVILVRNTDLQDMRFTMRQLEDRFNKNYKYTYVFLNDVPFTDDFKELTTSLTEARTLYGVIPHEHWSYPPWIDTNRADEARAQMDRDGIIYGGSLPYRHMCR